jgi:hypothetical protein
MAFIAPVGVFVFRSLIPSLNSPESLYKQRATSTRQRRQVEPTWHGQKQQHAGRRYKKHILPPGMDPTAPVLLYLRSAPATALQGLGSVPLLIAGASLCNRLSSLGTSGRSGRNGLPARRCSSAALHNVVIGPTGGRCEANL